MTLYCCIFLDSVLAWWQVAEQAKVYADAKGVEALTNLWQPASTTFNDIMTNDHTNAAAAAQQLNNAADSFLAIAGHVPSNAALTALFPQVYTEFKPMVARGNDTEIDQYMIAAYQRFLTALGC